MRRVLEMEHKVYTEALNAREEGSDDFLRNKGNPWLNCLKRDGCLGAEDFAISQALAKNAPMRLHCT